MDFAVSSGNVRQCVEPVLCWPIHEAWFVLARV